MDYISACPKDCYDSCSIITSWEKILKIRGNRNHPITAGFLCLKSKHFVEAHLSDKRLKKPLIRKSKRGEGIFEEIDLDSALDIIAEKIKFILKNYGPEKILPVEYAGNRALISYNFPQRFFNAIGALKLNHSMCDEAGGHALKELIGTSTGIDPENILKSDLVVYWGINPAWTNVHGWALAKRSGAKIYVVDPLITDSARGADKHLRIKIDSDIYLVLGLLNYFSRFGYNLEPMGKIVDDYDIERTSMLTGIDASDIMEFGNDLMNAKLPVIHIGYGFQRKKFGGLTVQAIETLLIALNKPENFIYDAKHNIDYDYLRGRNDNRKIVNQANLARELERLDIKMMFVYNSNPLNSLPNQNLLRKVIEEKDIFMVVHDLYLTDTARYADIVIPAASFLEFNDLVDSYYHDYLNLNQKVFDPPGEAVSNHDLFVKLSERLGLNDPSLRENEEDIIKKILADLNVDAEELYRKGFAKIERLKSEIKINPNPFLNELKNFRPEERQGFRLLTLTSIQGISSQHNNLYEFDTYVRMNSRDALKLSIKNGDEIIVENEYGSIKTVVKIEDSVPEGVMLMYKGSWSSIHGWTVNFLTTDSVQEKFAGGTALNSTFVNIRTV